MVTKSERDKIFAVLSEVLDPEVPALSIVDLGIVREVANENGNILVTITPTYSGCPAMSTIESEIKKAVVLAGYDRCEIKTVLAPAWTSDWISENGRAKLKAYGIAPPQGKAADLVAITSRIPCPFCESKQTEVRSRFGPTACKGMYFCRACNQPFEHFKDF